MSSSPAGVGGDHGCSICLWAVRDRCSAPVTITTITAATMVSATRQGMAAPSLRHTAGRYPRRCPGLARLWTTFRTQHSRDSRVGDRSRGTRPDRLSPTHPTPSLDRHGTGRSLFTGRTPVPGRNLGLRILFHRRLSPGTGTPTGTPNYDPSLANGGSQPAPAGPGWMTAVFG